MRVITGKYKGRKLVAPSDARPTLDRTKETLFNILNGELQNSVVLDLFAGSGQIGIECLSRGAKRVAFCDNNKNSVCAVKQNCSQLGITPELYFCDYADCLKRLDVQFDIVFVDPPYNDGLYKNIFTRLEECGTVKSGGIVICEHLRADVFDDVIGNFVKYDERNIGTVSFSFYKR